MKNNSFSMIKWFDWSDRCLVDIIIHCTQIDADQDPNFTSYPGHSDFWFI